MYEGLPVYLAEMPAVAEGESMLGWGRYKTGAIDDLGGKYLLGVAETTGRRASADLQKDPVQANVKQVVGYGLIALVFWAYMPAVIGIAYITYLNNLAKTFPVFESMAEDPDTSNKWEDMMGSLALQLFISFVPTFSTFIFPFFYVLKAQAWLQNRIQNWYYRFQVVYVLPVMAVGSLIISTLDEIIAQPTYVFYLMATTMLFATHYYLNLIPLQRVVHAQNLLRTKQHGKLFAFRALYGNEVVKQMAEPEDQGYYGLGSRCARHSFLGYQMHISARARLPAMTS